jgi:hypothetical protein
MANAMAARIGVALGVFVASAQLGLDCAKPERARALIDYAQLSEIKMHKDFEERCRASIARGHEARAVS